MAAPVVPTKLAISVPMVLLTRTLRGQFVAVCLAQLRDELILRVHALLQRYDAQGVRQVSRLLDAGLELGLSKSWASRLHARAVERLRALMAEESG